MYIGINVAVKEGHGHGSHEIVDRNRRWSSAEKREEL